MSQRLMAALIAGPLVLVLLVLSAFLPLDYVTYRPGFTVNVLGETDGSEIIQVDGAPSYRDDGALLMTTVRVSPPKEADGECGRGCRKNLYDLMAAWVDPDDAVYPYDAVYDEKETQETNERRGAVAMVTSQDAAVAVALRELGLKVTSAVEVSYVEEGMPAEGKLLVGDVLLEVDGEKVTSADQIYEAGQKTKPGESVDFRIRRDRTELDVSIEPRTVDGERLIGITPGNGFEFPFDVRVTIDPDIGGPSAGLMFSLGIYDTLTPGSLTDGRVIAGTGEIASDGTVGAIGGIQQKIAGAREDGAQLFLVPSENCKEALGADRGDMRLVRATTMHESLEAVEDWVADTDADLPACEDAA